MMCDDVRDIFFRWLKILRNGLEAIEVKMETLECSVCLHPY